MFLQNKTVSPTAQIKNYHQAAQNLNLDHILIDDEIEKT